MYTYIHTCIQKYTNIHIHTHQTFLSIFYDRASLSIYIDNKYIYTNSKYTRTHTLTQTAPGFVGLDGVMYHCGGNTPEGRSDRLYKYDPDNFPTWILLDAVTAGVQGQQPTPRSRFDITALGRSVYVFGGWTASGHANDLLQYDTLRLKWNTLDIHFGVTGDPPSLRYFFGITTFDDAVLVFGGMTKNGASDELFRFIPRMLT